MLIDEKWIFKKVENFWFILDRYSTVSCNLYVHLSKKVLNLNLNLILSTAFRQWYSIKMDKDHSTNHTSIFSVEEI